MTTPPALSDVQLREAVCAAIVDDALKPRAERLGLVDAMLAVVWPQFDAARTDARASEESAAILQRQIDAQAAELDAARAENAAMTDLRDRAIARQDQLRTELADTARFRDHYSRVANNLARKRDRAEQLIGRYRAGDISAEDVLDRIERTLAVDATSPPAGCGCRTATHPGHWPTCPTRTQPAT
jgi:uncharacterized protein YhaN